MIKNIVLNGYPDLFHLRLICAFMKAPNNYRFFFWGSEAKKQVLLTLSSHNHELHEYISVLLSIPWINTPPSVPFDIWHIDSAAELSPCFSSKIIDKNDRELVQLSKVCSSANVKEIVYSSSNYQLVEEKENGSMYGTQVYLAQRNEEAIKRIGAANKVAVRIISSPLLFRRTHTSIDTYLFRKVSAFVCWVNSRMPDYFLSYPLTLPESDTTLINTISMDQAVSLWQTVYLTNDNHYLDCNEYEASLFSQVNIALGKMGITTVFSDDPSDFSLIDSLLVDYLLYYFPRIERKDNHSTKNKLSSVNSVSKAEANALFHHLPSWQINNHVQMIAHLNNANQSSTAIVSGDGHRREVHTIRDNFNGEITYFSKGEGKAILLCSAYGIKTDAWEKVISRLSEHNRVIFWNTREVVKSIDGTRYSCVTDQAEDIALIANAEQLSEFSICSWCSGVKSAVIYEKTHPNRVKSQIFIAGEFAPYQNSQGAHSAYRNSLCRMAEMVEKDSRMIDYFMRIIHSGVFVNPEKGNDSRISKFFDIVPIAFRGYLLAPFCTPQAMMQYLAMCTDNYTYDITNYLKDTKTPTLLICADHDSISPSEQTKWAYQQLYNAHLVCLPASSHLLILERADEVCRLIDQHICLYT